MSWWGNLRKTHSFIWWTCDMDQEYKSLRENWTSRKNWTYAFCNPWTRINVHSFSRFLPNTAIVLLSMGRSVFLGSPDPSPYLVDLDFGVAQSAKVEKEVGNVMLNDIIYLNPGKFQNLDQDGKVGIQTKVTRYEKVRKVLHPRIVLYPRNPSVCQESFFWGFWRKPMGKPLLECKLVNVLNSVRVVYIIVLLANLELWGSMELTNCWIVRLVWWFLQVLNFLESFCIWGSLLSRVELSV